MIIASKVQYLFSNIHHVFDYTPKFAHNLVEIFIVSC